MELLPPVPWTDLARGSDLVAVRGEMASLGADLRSEMADLRTELKTEMAELRIELKTEMAELRTEVGAVRADLVELGARIDAQVPRFVLTMLPFVFATAGLVFGAIKLA